MNNRRVSAFGSIALFIALAAAPVVADTINVPGDQPTIQAGIDAAGEGDTVLVAAGSYAGALIMRYGGITLKADGAVFLSAPGDEILECYPDEYPISRVLVEGFTFEASMRGIWSESDFPLTVRNCTFRDMVGVNSVAIASIGNAPLIVENCQFRNNQAAGIGGAIGVTIGPATFTDCVFEGNSADIMGGAVFTDTGFDLMLFDNCVFAGNTSGNGGAIIGLGGDFTVRNCTFFGNEASDGGILAVEDGADMTVENCIVAGSPNGSAFLCETGSELILSCSDVWGNADGDWISCAAGQNGLDGNISEDPRFCDALSGDLTLYNLSPCLAVNNSCNARIGVFGLGCVETGTGIPQTAVESAYWGQIKRLY